MLLNGFFRAFTDFNDLIKEKLKDFKLIGNIEKGQFVKITSKGPKNTNKKKTKIA